MKRLSALLLVLLMVAGCGASGGHRAGVVPAFHYQHGYVLGQEYADTYLVHPGNDGMFDGLQCQLATNGMDTGSTTGAALIALRAGFLAGCKGMPPATGLIP